MPPPPGGSGDAGSRPGTPLRREVDEKREKSPRKVEEKAEVKLEKSDELEHKSEESKKESQPQELKAVDSESDDEFVDAVGGVISPMSVTASGGDVAANPVDGVPSVVATSELKSVEEKKDKRQSVDTIQDTSEATRDGEKGLETTSSALTPEDLEPSLAAASTALGGIQKADDKSDDSESDGIKEDGRDSKEVYVGDATWEERTWKEVVRLKEDMFWARVGGWRD